MGFILLKVAGGFLGGRSFLLACLAAFRQVLELLVVKEELFSCGKYKLLATIHTFEHSVLEFHGFPFRPRLHNIAITPGR